MVGRREWMWRACLLLCIVASPCWAQSDTTNAWKRQIVVQLEAHKHFPLEAIGKDGSVRVAFILDRAGKLISTDILSAGGVPALDKAALEMIRSAQPFPPAPPGVTGKDLKFVAPVFFRSAIGSSPETP
ncbi:energy transducer TonB family protein [Bradyrhizobium sp.]|uniref:energy transducer TonB family protein n=1 Tax=Bradyrhizobium sp. TaxID=376 RepID=UPI003C3BA898